MYQSSTTYNVIAMIFITVTRPHNFTSSRTRVTNPQIVLATQNLFQIILICHQRVHLYRTAMCGKCYEIEYDHISFKRHQAIAQRFTQFSQLTIHYYVPWDIFCGCYCYGFDWRIPMVLDRRNTIQWYTYIFSLCIIIYFYYSLLFRTTSKLIFLIL